MIKLNSQQVQEKLSSEGEKVCYIDVRSPDEFRSGHLPGAVCVPLDKIEKNPNLIPRDKLVILGCHSGMRSARARELLASIGYDNLLELEGGFTAWAASGLPIMRQSQTISVMSQFILLTGILIFISSILAVMVNKKFALIPLYISAGFIFSGTTGRCGLMLLLEKMPWNRAP